MDATSDPWGSPDECLAWVHKLTPGNKWSFYGDYGISYNSYSSKWYCVRHGDQDRHALSYKSELFEDCKAWLIAVILTGA
jgi:hypothetical protein